MGVIYLFLFISVLGYGATAYYSDAEQDIWGDFSYKNKVPKKLTKGKLYYEVQYKRGRIYIEKHYDINGKITYFATIKYIKNNKYIKYEYIKSKGIIKVKTIANIKKYSFNKDNPSKYSMIKYFKVVDGKKVLVKVKEYYENNAVQSISYYSNNILSKQEQYNWKGAISSIIYYKVVDNKVLKWKEEKYVYDKEDRNIGHLVYEYDSTGKVVAEKFYPKME